MTAELTTDMLQAQTPEQFRKMLRLCREWSGLTNGQIAVKTHIPRSQAYALTSETRTGLPTRPDQVRAFVEACGLTPIQVAVVMKEWSRLNDKIRAAPDDTTNPGDHDTHKPTALASGGIVQSGSISGLVMRHPSRRPVRLEGRSDFLNLVFLVLDDPDRSYQARQLLLLLLPILLLVVVLVVGLVGWAVLQPRFGGTALGMVGTTCAGSLAAVASRRRRRDRR